MAQEFLGKTFKNVVPTEWETVPLLAENGGITDSFEMTTATLYIITQWTSIVHTETQEQDFR